MITERWTSCNCKQCWTCKNCTDQYETLISIAIKNSPLKNENVTLARDAPIFVSLPYCKVMDLAVTHVINNPCDRYEKN